MATVTITGGTGDAGAIGDNRPWKLWAAVYQSDGTGGVITTRKDREANVLRPVGGVLTFEAEAGIAVYLETPEGRRYLVTIPETNSDLWSLIEASVAYPPETSQAALNAAVGQYVIDHGDTIAFDDLTYSIEGGATSVQFMRDGNPLGPEVPFNVDAVPSADLSAAVASRLSEQTPAAVAAELTTAIPAALAAAELVARMDMLPTAGRRSLIENLVYSLMAEGVWNKLDGFYVLAAHSEQAAKLNWIGSGMQTITAVNAPTFQVDRGFTGDGATNYLDSNTPANTLANYKAEDATLGVYVRTSASGSNRIEVSAGSGAHMNPHQSGNVILRANRSADSAIQISNGGNGAGLFAWSRDATTVTAYRAGSSLGSSSVGAGSVASSNVRFLAATSANYGNRQIQVGLVGAGLSSSHHAALNSAVVAYLTAIGAN